MANSHLQVCFSPLPFSGFVFTAFVSRTGKTTDVTQIKGWREKFSPSEVPSIATSAKPEGEAVLLLIDVL